MGRDAVAVQFVKVTKESVHSFLGKAQNQVIIAKAGYFVEEIGKKPVSHLNYSLFIPLIIL